MENINNAIEVRNLYKRFKIQYDKPTTLKESLVSVFKKKDVEYHEVLKNINIDIKNTKAPYLSNFTSEVEFLAGRVLYPTINEISPIGIFIKNIKCQLR